LLWARPAAADGAAKVAEETADAVETAGEAPAAVTKDPLEDQRNEPAG